MTTNLLISNPSFGAGFFQLPYLWGRIREYCEYQDSRDFSDVNFLDPIWIGPSTVDMADKFCEPYDWKKVDILFISNYVWNWKLNLKIAEIAKHENPNILVVAGGPQTLYKPHQEVSLYYICDYVTPFEGEKISADILYNYKNNLPLDDIEGLVDPRNPKYVTQKRLNVNNFNSPYLLYAEDYKRFCSNFKNSNISAIWETNRGCPYSCTFCDWGSTTNSKIKMFNDDTVLSELEFLVADLKIGYLFNPDANFGILPRDIEYAKKLSWYKKKYGYPKHGMYLSPAKNNADRVNEVLKILHDAELISFVQISYQHTDQDVLRAIKRDNIDIDKISLYMHESFTAGVPMQATIILGNPGDTYDKWIKNLCEMFERRFHDIRVHDFQMLPNAPASEPDYIKQWGLKWFEANFSKNEYGVIDINEVGSTQANLLYETSTYSKEDWFNMQIFTSMILGFESLNALKMLTMFLRNYYNIKYLDLYKNILTLSIVEECSAYIRTGLKDWVYNNGWKAFEYNGVYYSADTYFKVKCITERKRFFSEITDMILEKYPFVDNDILIDIIKYQDISINDWRNNKEEILQYDIPSIIDKIFRLPPLQDPGNLLAEKQQVKISACTEFDSYENWKVSRVHAGWNMRAKNNISEIICEKT